MLQNEIDEISDAFSDAWHEYFGQRMYYIKFDKSATAVHPVYGESKQKVYKEAEKVEFYGTLKESPIQETGEMRGSLEYQYAEITFVTRDLEKQGITQLDNKDIIEVVTKIGDSVRYNITSTVGKVQLSSSKVFTKIGVMRSIK